MFPSRLHPVRDIVTPQTTDRDIDQTADIVLRSFHMMTSQICLRMMTKYLLLALFLGVAMASEYDDSALMDQGEGRFLYLNSSSTATSLTLLGALILLGVIFYLVYVGGLLSPAASSYSRYGQDYNQYYQGYQGQAR